MIKVSIDQHVMQSFMREAANQLKSKIELNLDHVKKLCKKQYGIKQIAGVENKDAKIVIFKDQLACKLNFEVRFPMSILITTVDNSNNTLPENNDIPEEADDLEAKFDQITAELDALTAEDVDGMPEDLDEMPQEIDLDDLEVVHDVIDKPIEQPQMAYIKRKSKNNS